MVTSMTGYGRSQQSIDGRDITVEIKSVNHRYFEFSARVPRAFGYLEEKLKGYLQGKISRGKVEAGVTVVDTGAAHTAVDINHELAASYINAMRVTGEKLSLQDDLTVSSLMRFSDLFSVHRVQEDEETIWTEVRLVADGAIERFIALRATEGERLKADILERLESIESRVAAVAEQSPRTEAAYRERLTAKIREVLEDRQIDETRIVTEAAIFADKIAVDEETVRLRSHIASFRDILGAFNGPIGRKLDFLVQEMNREANTIGSKAQDAATAQVLVEIKSEIEKIREQMQKME